MEDPSFRLFSSLPFELRREVWLHYLAEATPRVYRFSLRYPFRSRIESLSSGLAFQTYHYRPRPDDYITLLPCAFVNGERQNGHLDQFISSTLAGRAAGAVCHESREILAEVLPNSINFQVVPPSEDSPSHYLNNNVDPDEAQYPEYSLRFNSQKDIIVFDCDWEDQEAVAEIVKLEGQPPEAFLPIQNVGISYGAFERGHAFFANELTYGVDPRECMCDTEACDDCCRLEPLPQFLACFPALRTFYIARVAEDMRDPPDNTQDYIYDRIQDASCRCSTEEESSQPKHVWPVIRATDSCEWCVIYDERSECSFPKLHLVERIRDDWRPFFPYYDALKYLDIRFLRRLDPDRPPTQAWLQQLQGFYEL